jgi:CubicO group peptidase (beta-lactamase class C family)
MAGISKRRIWGWAMGAMIVAVLAAAEHPLYRSALVGAGYTAEILCSGLFVSHRKEEDIVAQDLSGPGYELLVLFFHTIDADKKRVTASIPGFASQTAIFRDGLGCTLLNGRSEDELTAKTAALFADPPLANDDALWPEGERVDLGALDQGVDKVALDKAVAAVFTEPHPLHPRRTRALVVVHHGRIVAERYAPGFDAAMPLQGWSMSKSALNALVGLRVKDGKLAVTDKALLPEWRGPGDKRADISLDDLLRMSSGLVFDENYDDPLADVTQMLFTEPDEASFAAAKELAYPPGTHWHYSSGTSEIISRVLRNSFASQAEYLRFPHERLFGPIGMKSAVLTSDANGTFTASSFLYATARDFARLGLLFLQDGVWQGQQILPDGWVVYSRGPSRARTDGSYGAHIWLKLPNSPQLGVPPMPEDAYYFLGHDEQTVAIIPSRDLVIVRLGLTRKDGDWDDARDLAPIVQAFPPWNSSSALLEQLQ